MLCTPSRAPIRRVHLRHVRTSGQAREMGRFSRPTASHVAFGLLLVAVAGLVSQCADAQAETDPEAGTPFGVDADPGVGGEGAAGEFRQSRVQTSGGAPRRAAARGTEDADEGAGFGGLDAADAEVGRWRAEKGQRTAQRPRDGVWRVFFSRPRAEAVRRVKKRERATRER